jgi:protein tyrosine phosphatase (PTP) superfamily phosphohydrolase (DUF442 family)
MKKNLAWILFSLSMLAGCRTYSRAPAPAFARPAEPIPVTSAPTVLPAQAVFPRQGPPQSSYFTPQPNCACPAPSQKPFPLAPAPHNPPIIQGNPTPSNTSPANSYQGPPQVQLSPPIGIPPENTQPPPISVPPPNKTPEPPQAPSALPAGIPQFSSAREGVTGGLRPSLDDGLDWLQANGYRAVLHLRLPGEVNDADRHQVEKRGMKYLSLEVSPHTLQQRTLEEFASLVKNPSLHPLFVYDREGALAGGLWYWYFRTVEQQTDDVARVRAVALGLRENRNGLHQEMWLALQKILSER